jgi:lysine 2,3-aminomutase
MGMSGTLPLRVLNSAALEEARAEGSVDDPTAVTDADAADPAATALERLEDGAWRDQLRASARTAADLEHLITLTEEERDGLAALEAQGGLPLGVTPHFLALIDGDDPRDPLRRQVIPRADELSPSGWDRRDPLGEEDLEAVPFLVHRYPDRVLLLATDRCAAYCRFCTRKRWVGQGPGPGLDHLEQAIAYVAAHEEIREVIVSGGDALMLADEKLAALLDALGRIAHLDVVRLATRMLAFVPQRVTRALVRLLKEAQARGGPAVYVLSHFNHPRELAAEARAAIARLVDAGVPVLNQTVLLRGVNDDRACLIELFRALTRLRARPYYLHQCDLAPGTDAFRVPLDEARALYGSLRGPLSGISIPTFVVDIPGGLGKAPLSPDPIVEVAADHVVLRGFRGALARYPR